MSMPPLPPTDPRHGSTRGYHAGCRLACCKAALARYEKRRRFDRLHGGSAIPALGAQRRIQALMRLGYTSTDIATAAGWADRNYVLRILNGQKGKPTRWLERKTDAAIREVFSRLAMKLPEQTGYRARTANWAAGKGWLPPLAWDDIDDPNERPATGRGRKSHDDIDEAVVLRFMCGEAMQTTRAEKEEIVRRWRAAGRSLNDLERRTGWKVERYGRPNDLTREVA